MARSRLLDVDRAIVERTAGPSGPRSSLAGVIEPGEREQRLFAVLTAVYHGMPEAVALIAEMTDAEARETLRDAAALVQGLLIAAEVSGRVERGTALPRLVEKVRLDREGGGSH